MEDSQEVSFRLEAYDYDLPPELIAQHPAPARDSPACSCWTGPRLNAHSRFDKIKEYLRSGDLLVVNDTRVVPARLSGRKTTGGKVEFLVLDPYKPPELGERRLLLSHKSFEALSPRANSRVCRRRLCRDSLCARGWKGAGAVFGSFPYSGPSRPNGRTPLPPYIERGGSRRALGLPICYQTEYAAHPGAVAAPTAGLHFTKTLLKVLWLRGGGRSTYPARGLRHFFAPKVRRHSPTSDALRVYRNRGKDRERGKQGKARTPAGPSRRDDRRSHSRVGSQNGAK